MTVGPNPISLVFLSKEQIWIHKETARVCECTEERPHEDTVRSLQAEETGLKQNQTCQYLGLGLLAPEL